MNIRYIVFALSILSGLTFISWLYSGQQLNVHVDTFTQTIGTTIKQFPIIVINDDTAFNHNFCESKLQNNKGPELWNAWTSLVISAVPFIYGFPKYPLLYNVACMLSVNGVASFHYHYYLNWFGKQGDEMSMILANYFGIWGLINMYYKKSERRNNLNRYNTAFMYLFLVSNTLVDYDPLFPTIFGVYVGGSLIMIYQVGNMYKIPYKKNLLVSFIGASCWIISEHFCNKYTTFGHPIWHLMFPLGFYKLILDYDKVKQRLPVKVDDFSENQV